jgi:ectoine hydroxylase-related dioxygenase (phytanoyl-CoA dioxygenase family)
MKLTKAEIAAGRLSAKRLHEAVRAFRDTGLVTLEGAYTRERIEELRAAYEVELEKHLAQKGGLEALEGKTFGRNHIGFFPPMLGTLAEEDVAAHPIACQIMDEVIGRDFHCSFFHTNSAYPGSGIQPIHRDTSLLFPGEPCGPVPAHILVVNVPLCDFTVENGSTEVWPGTHLTLDVLPEDGKDLETRAALCSSIRTNVKVGSLILRDMRCFHRGMPNNSTQIRTMMAIVYQRVWLMVDPVTIPQSTWDSWPERVRRVYRRNRVVPDAKYNPRTWEHE